MSDPIVYISGPQMGAIVLIAGWIGWMLRGLKEKMKDDDDDNDDDGPGDCNGHGSV